jgi:hypothetical protein
VSEAHYGKALVRRTATAYKADAMDKRAKLLKVRYLYGNRGSRCAASEARYDISVKAGRITRGGLSVCRR